MSLFDELAAKLKDHLTSPAVLGAILAGLRKHDRIVVIGGHGVVTRHADVVEVLENDRDFGVTEVYAARMRRTTGPFLLGMEDTPRYRDEVAFIRQAVRADDLRWIREIVARGAGEALDAAPAGGALDVVARYSRLLPLQVVDEFFGVPGPDAATMARWMRTIFWDIFLNFTDDRAVSDAAARSSGELRVYLNELLARRKASIAGGSHDADDFVTRLLRTQLAVPATIDDDMVRRNVGGVIVGAVDTTSKAVIHALDQLLRRPDELAGAAKAARDGDDALLEAYVFEALRFNPHNPIIVRTCHRDTTIATGTSRETTIPNGTTVYAATLSAMFDPAVVERPDEFRIGRPPSSYMHFGRGRHTCFGERINRVTVPEAIKHVLCLRGLRRADGPDGVIRYEGPFPDRYIVRFDP